MRLIFAAALTALLAACASRPALVAPATDFAPRIERDAYGVPTIHARTDPEAAFGLAIAHAEDDFHTIQLVVLAARGRLGAHAGAEGARSDFFYHVLRVEDAVRDNYDTALTPETRALIEAYAAGLNTYAAEHPEETLRGAENVTGRDIAAGFTLTSPLFWGFDGVLARLVDEDAHPCAIRTPPSFADDRGSNAFAVAPARSGDGATRLVVNSHQPWDGPVAWWEARLRTDNGWTMQGGVFPGSPVPLLGHNRDLGYAATVNTPDLADLYRLHTDDAHPDQYFYDGQWRDFEIRRVTLRVKTGPITLPIRRTLYFTIHGPAFETADGWIAVRYANAGDIRGVEQYYRMSRARNFDEWRAALDMRAIASTNLVYADRAGRIAYIYNASSPVRAPGHDWRGCVDGSTSATLSPGLVPLSEIPHLVDPPSGWVFNANATPFSATDPPHDLRREDFAPELGIEPRVTNRALRAVELLAGDPAIGFGDLFAAKFDLTYSANSEMARLLERIAALDTSADPALAGAQALLARWNRTASLDSREAALALLVFEPFYEARRTNRPYPDVRATLESAVAALRRATGGPLDPPLGDVLRLRRGDQDLPLAGGPDLLRAIGWRVDEDARLAANFGDGLIIIAEWSADGTLTSRSIHQYGAATGRPGSPHYADQSPLFVRNDMRIGPP